jgi:hypothetical protein
MSAVWDKLTARFYKTRPVEPAPKVVESVWRPAAQPTLPESPREKLLRERRARRKSNNRTKNKLAHAARRENWHG